MRGLVTTVCIVCIWTTMIISMLEGATCTVALGNTAGDVNLDGIINILDIIEMVSIILGNYYYNELADLNSDGMVNVIDVIQLVSIILSP